MKTAPLQRFSLTSVSTQPVSGHQHLGHQQPLVPADKGDLADSFQENEVAFTASDYQRANLIRSQVETLGQNIRHFDESAQDYSNSNPGQTTVSGVSLEDVPNPLDAAGKAYGSVGLFRGEVDIIRARFDDSQGLSHRMELDTERNGTEQNTIP